MQAVNDVLLPVLSAILVLLIPACARFAYKALSKKMDEGRVIAAESRDELVKLLTDHLAEADAIAGQRHRDNVDRFDRIEIQTTSTNGRLAEHDKRLTTVEAETRLLVRLFPVPKQPDKGA